MMTAGQIVSTYSEGSEQFDVVVRSDEEHRRDRNNFKFFTVGSSNGGTVDLEFRPQEGGETKNVKGVDASKDIKVSGLQRTPRGIYKVTVTPTDVFKPTAQFVTIPASGFDTVEFIVDRGK